jgi:hypothetical protein
MAHPTGIALYVIFVILAIVSIVLTGIAQNDFRNNVDNVAISVYRPCTADINNKLNEAVKYMYIVSILLFVVAGISIVLEIEGAKKTVPMLMLFVWLIMYGSMYFTYKDLTTTCFIRGEYSIQLPQATTVTKTKMATESLIVTIVAIVFGLAAAYAYK